MNFRKILKSFMIISLFLGVFSFCKAEILVGSNTFDYETDTRNISSSYVYVNVTYSAITTAVKNHFDNPDSENYSIVFDNYVSELLNNNYKIFISVRDDGGYYVILIPDTFDFGVSMDTNYLYPLFSPLSIPNNCFFYGSTAGVFGHAFNSTNLNKTYRLNGIDISNPLYSNISVKYLDGGNSNSLIWDGSSYYYQVNSIVSEFELPNDDEIYSVHEALMNSDLTRRLSDHTRYFIVYNGVTGQYDAYFYPDVDLGYRYFELGSNNILSNYTDNVSNYMEFSVIEETQEDGFWESIWTAITNVFSAWDYQLFRTNSALTKFIYKRDIDHFNVGYSPGGLTLDLTCEAIVYTSHSISHLYVVTPGNIENGTFVQLGIDSDNSIDSTVLMNSSNGSNYVLTSVSENSTTSTGYWENLLSKISTDIVTGLTAAINFLFNVSDYLLAQFGFNVVSLIFAIIIKSITVLIASIGLIVRFVSFVLTLVSIPASSVLFSVDVAAPVYEGYLSFQGLSWGSKFVEGLNMLKAFNWNGLGLWTLFECFVSAIEVIFTIKIIRKHYNRVF